MRSPVSFLKVEISIPELKKAIDGFKESRIRMLNELQSEFKSSVADTLNQLLNAEMALFLGEPEQQDNKRNGFQIKEYALKGVGSIQLKVPADRKRRFSSAIVPKRERIDPRLKEDMAALHLAGLSTRTLSLMSERILGIEVSHQTISESLPMLSEHAQKWLTRPIEGDWWALIVGWYELQSETQRKR